jgi:hypothetical protein
LAKSPDRIGLSYPRIQRQGGFKVNGLKIIGGIILIVGIVLFVGNISGALVTFPGAGWLTMAVGGFMLRAES